MRMIKVIPTALMLAIGCFGQAAAADPVRLKFAFFTQETEMTWVTTIKPFIDAVNKDGAGVVQIDSFTNGALGRALPNQPQLVLDGVADFAFMIPGSSPGRFPDNGVIELPGIFRDLQEATAVYTRLLLSNSLRGYEQYVPIVGMGTPPFSIHTKSAISNLASLKGIKLRTTNATDGETLRTLGMVPVAMPINEAAEAIGRGTVDGSSVHPGPMFDFGLTRVTHYDYFVRLGISPLVVLMNKAKFDSLPPQAQDIIRRNAGEVLVKIYNKGYGEYTDELMAKLKADPTRHVIFPSDAEQQQAETLWQPVIQNWLEKDPRNPELLKKVQGLIADYRAGK
jgi:TRAP-type C4-dicarboxylate transport system substrate-binding protein